MQPVCSRRKRALASTSSARSPGYPRIIVVRTLIPAYGRRVAFVHQEIWQPGGMQTLTPTVEEWNLRSEPWTFVVDGDGMIRARFEGLTTRRELEAILRQMLR